MIKKLKKMKNNFTVYGTEENVIYYKGSDKMIKPSINVFFVRLDPHMFIGSKGVNF